MNEILQAKLPDLLRAIFESPHEVLSNDEAAAVVGIDNLRPLREYMEQQEWLMPSDSAKGAFELTFAGLKAAVGTYIPEILAGGGHLTAENLREAAGRNKQTEPELEVWSEIDPFRLGHSLPPDSEIAAFLLPEEGEVVQELVKAIPDTWSSLSGELRVSDQLIELGHASAHGGFRISEYNSRQIVVSDRGSYDAFSLPEAERRLRDEQVRGDLLDILQRLLLPGFIHFYRAGLTPFEFDFVSVRDMAVAYLEMGYAGQLEFRSQESDESHAPEEVDIEMQPWIPYGHRLRILRPPVVYFAWIPRQGGKRENVAALMELCRAGGLTELPVELEFSRW